MFREHRVHIAAQCAVCAQALDTRVPCGRRACAMMGPILIWGPCAGPVGVVMACLFSCEVLKSTICLLLSEQVGAKYERKRQAMLVAFVVNAATL
eukprot:298344-Pelagomonas_calceolata.AAC.13